MKSLCDSRRVSDMILRTFAAELSIAHGIVVGRDVDTGKAILRDYINATLGFRELSALTHKPAKSLMRMFSPNGNPLARNLLQVIGQLQEREGVRLQVQLHTR